jgi:phosphoribosyl-AMP cyclohydrolase
MSWFAERSSVAQVEEGQELAPRFDESGLIVAVTTVSATGTVLMVGHMTPEALKLTIETGEAYYWSRSRACLWHKGSVSGLRQRLVELRVDDDQDAVWLKVLVEGSGASCHVGYRSCFYREVPIGPRPSAPPLRFSEQDKVFDPAVVYRDAPNPTRL